CLQTVGKNSSEILQSADIIEGNVDRGLSSGPEHIYEFVIAHSILQNVASPFGTNRVGFLTGYPNEAFHVLDRTTEFKKTYYLFESRIRSQVEFDSLTVFSHYIGSEDAVVEPQRKGKHHY